MNTIITYVHDKRQNINRYFNQKVRRRMSEEGAADNYYYYYYYYLLLLNTTTDTSIDSVPLMLWDYKTLIGEAGKCTVLRTFEIFLPMFQLLTVI